jgi:hypothetical protein
MRILINMADAGPESILRKNRDEHPPIGLLRNHLGGDAKPNVALQTLAAVLGEPTMVVASGGEWTDPETGENQCSQV